MFRLGSTEQRWLSALSSNLTSLHRSSQALAQSAIASGRSSPFSPIALPSSLCSLEVQDPIPSVDISSFPCGVRDGGSDVTQKTRPILRS